MATIAFYGPTRKLATKIALGIISNGSADAIMTRWASDTDIRDNPETMTEVLDLLKANDIRSVVMVDKIIGCPHEEGIDYGKGESCPACPYWAHWDRWFGEPVH